MNKIKIKKFFIKKLEGKRADKNATVYCWSDVDGELLDLSTDAPLQGQGYDKTSLEITFEDGWVFKTRVDLNQGKFYNTQSYARKVFEHQFPDMLDKYDV